MDIIGRGATPREALVKWEKAATEHNRERAQKIMALLLEARSLDKKLVRTRFENSEYVCDGRFSGNYLNLSNEIRRLVMAPSNGRSAGMLDELFIDPALAHLKFSEPPSTRIHASNRHEIAEP